MAVYTNSFQAHGATDADVLAWTQGLSTLLQSVAELTKVNDLSALFGVSGSAAMDFVQKTATGVTTTSGSRNFSGTFSGGGLTAQDVGRNIKVPGAGAAGAVLHTHIETVTGAGSGTFATNAGTSVAGTGTAVVGIYAGRSAANNFGFEIYRFNDAFQATAPVFIKIIYGETSGGFPAITFQVGQGSNGFGELTGHRTTARAFTGGTTNLNVNPSFAVGGAGRFNLLFNFVNSNTFQGSFYMSVHRSVSTSGVQTADYVNVITQGLNGGITAQILPKAQGGGAPFPAASVNNVMASVPSDGAVTTANFNGVVGVFPVHPYKGRADSPCMDAVIVFLNDVPAGNTLEVTMYGATRTFFVLASYNSGSAMSAAGGRSSGTAFAMRYE